MAAVLVFAVYPVGRDFVCAAADKYSHCAVLYAGVNSTAEYGLDVCWKCRGGYVPIPRGYAKYAVSYAAAYGISFIAVGFKLGYDVLHVIRKYDAQVFFFFDASFGHGRGKPGGVYVGFLFIYAAIDECCALADEDSCRMYRYN